MPEAAFHLRLSEASGVPYYRQIVDQIAHRIRSGELKPGTRLPSVRDLAADLVVSLITTRRAYADLEAAGLIVLRQGQGTFVAEEIARASRAEADRDATEHLAAAIRRARDLGLDEEHIRERVEEILAGKKRQR